MSDPSQFRSGRQFRLARADTAPVLHRRPSDLGTHYQAWDVYLRTLLIHGARSALITLSRRTDQLSRWAAALTERRGFKKACVAMAAKNARIIWALLAKGEDFRLERAAA